METLLKILGMKRPHGGAGELEVVSLVDRELGFITEAFVSPDGAEMAYTYTTDATSKTLFVSHLDTVHHEDGPNPVKYDPDMGLMWKEDGDVLGADDGAGVWLMLEMAKDGVPGTYLWTTGEERGGVGARWLADNKPDWLGQFDRAISFDRKGTDSVITHQGWGGRCCSDKFAESLAMALNVEFKDDSWRPDSTGVYTDTAEFTHLIPECTNCSIGYMAEHTGNEVLDVTFLIKLRAACIALDWEILPTVRDPKEVEHGFGTRFTSADPYTVTPEEFMAMDDADIQDMVYYEPEAVYELLLSLKYDAWMKETY